jgi:hypothetical protein
MSPTNNDNAWQTPSVWSYTWIGNQPNVGIDKKEPFSVPLTYSLGDNYPNPFNPVTTITYSIAHPGPVELTVFNLLGQVVAELVNEIQPAGEYSVQWQPKGIASGIYLYRLKAGDFVETRKLVLVK